MSPLKFVVFLCLISLSMTSVVIDLEEDELQQIAAILVDNYIEHNLVPKCNSYVSVYLKKGAANLGQFVGIMFSLVGANILTKMYEHSTAEPTIIADINNNSTILSEICDFDNDHGCDAGQCWRSCGEQSEVSNSFCFTMSKSKEKCSSSDDCNECGECINECTKYVLP